MPEIERESILAAREDEMQKFRDSQQLDLMFRMAGADEDDEHARKKSKSACDVADNRKTHERDEGSLSSYQRLEIET